MLVHWEPKSMNSKTFEICTPNKFRLWLQNIFCYTQIFFNSFYAEIAKAASILILGELKTRQT